MATFENMTNSELTAYCYQLSTDPLVRLLAKRLEEAESCIDTDFPRNTRFND